MSAAHSGGRLLRRLHALGRRLILSSSFRRRFERESAETFAALLNDARERGSLAPWRLLARELVAMVGYALAERRAASRPGHRLVAYLDALGADLRLAARLARGSALHSAITVVTIGLGLTLTGGAWALVRGALLNPLPFAEADRLVQIWTVMPAELGGGDSTVSPHAFRAISTRITGLDAVAAHGGWPTNVRGEGLEAERVSGAWVTVGLFDLLGVAPIVGSGFTPEHAVPGADGGVLLSHAYWRDRFGADPAVIGRIVELDERAHPVLGVLPPDFDLPDPYDPVDRVSIYFARSFGPEELASTSTRYLRVVGRLAAGASVAEVNEQLTALGAEIARRDPDNSRGTSLRALSLREQFFGPVRPMLLMLQAAAVAVLLIALVNVSSLALARGRQRRGELAVRAALGAGGSRLARQLVTEYLLLCGIGLGLAVASLTGLEPRLLELTRERIARFTPVAVDAGVLALISVLAAVAAVALGLLAASERRGGVSELPAGRLAVAGNRVSQRARAGLVVAQIAFTVTLVLAAGLLMRSLLALAADPPGFDATGVLMLEVSPPADAYPGADGVRGYYADLDARIGSLPGVESVGRVSDPPFISENRARWINWIAAPVPESERPLVEYRTVSAHYFEALRIPLVAGRGFEAADRPGSPLVMLVNETFARQLGGGREATPGTGVAMGVGGDSPDVVEIVGVVGDERDDGFGSAMEPLVYLLDRQLPSRRMTLTVRTSGDPRALAPAARAAVRELDPRVPISDLRTLDDLLASSLTQERLSASLAGAAALLALALAGIGIYGIVGFDVASRTREIGVRTALGARPRRVIGEVMGQALRLTAVGVGLGVLGGALVSRWLESLLFGVGTLDPVSFLAAPLILSAVAIVAAALPARRAARVSPVEALRG